nr:hypothetical protein HAGR004_12790 [Bdellovibrio sp. HAGR004]
MFWCNLTGIGSWNTIEGEASLVSPDNGKWKLETWRLEGVTEADHGVRQNHLTHFVGQILGVLAGFDVFRII